MSRLFINKSFHRSGKKANTSLNVSANNNITNEDEILLQEKNRMNHTVCGAPIKSPSSKFYRNNSNPFPETVSCAPPVQETQKKVEDSKQQKSFGKFLRYIRPNSKKKKHPSHDDESSKLSDELDISSKSSPHKVHSQIYEQSINKHGDVVDYAVPYYEQLVDDIQSPIETINDCASQHCEDLADVNVLNESQRNDRLDDINLLNIISPVKVTDLDKSSDGSRSLNHSGMNDPIKTMAWRVDLKCIFLSGNNNKEVLTELDLLERWSQNIQQRSLPPQEPVINKVSSA